MAVGIFFPTFELNLTSCQLLPVWVLISLICALLLERLAMKSIQRLSKIYHDFSERRFYNPFKSSPYVFVQSKEHINELAESSELSQRAVFSDIFNFEKSIELIPANEPLAVRPRLFGRVLQTMSRSQLGTLEGKMKKRIEELFSKYIESSPADDGWSLVRLADLIREASVETMMLPFFGVELPKNPVFKEALLEYLTVTVRTMIAWQLLPSKIAPWFRTIIAKNHRARAVIVLHLAQIIRTQGVDWNEEEDLKSRTVVGMMTEVTQDSKYWTPEGLAHAIVGLWFASYHQPWVQTYFVIIELLQRREYIPILRREIETLEAEKDAVPYEAITNLSFLDAFIKETLRNCPTDTVSVRRKALAPYAFGGGSPQIPEGKVACVDAEAILHDPQRYTNPELFDPVRWLQHGKEERRSASTDVSPDFPLWGVGSKHCPGRYHAMYILKLFVIHLLTNYNFELVGEPRDTWFRWDTFRMPTKSTVVKLQKRYNS